MEIQIDIQQVKINPLSRVQEKILALICEEKTNEEISLSLFISKRTVEWHKNKLLVKTGAKNSIGLLKYAIKNKIVRLEPE